MTVVLLLTNTMLVSGHQNQHKYRRSDGITRSAGIMPGEPCPLTNIHPNIHVPGQTLAINSNRAPRMRSICPLSVCSFGEYVYVTAEPISLPFLCPPHTPYHPRTNLSAHHQMPRESPSIGCAGLNRRFSKLIFRQFTKFFRFARKTKKVGTRERT